MMKGRRDERGAVAIMVAMVAVVLFIIAAMVVDLGLARDTRRQAQNAADAASLAASNALYPPSGFCSDGTVMNNGCVSDAVAAAQTYAASNFGVTATDWTTCPAAPAGLVVPPSAPSCIAFDLAVRPTKVRVQIPARNVSTGLGVVAGVTSIRVGSAARAAVEPGRRFECGICVLGPGPHTIGNGDALSGGSDVHFNGSVSTGPNGGVCAGTYNAATDTCTATANITVESAASGSFTPAPLQNQGRIDDPWANTLALPPSPLGSYRTGSPCTQGPGIYTANFTFPSGACQLISGLYVVTGVWELDNNSNVTSAPGGVNLYFTCKSSTTPATVRQCGSTNGGMPEAGGQFNRKNGQITISAKTTGGLANYAVVYDRLNNSDLDLQGNGTSDITGNVYAPNALLYANGTSSNTFRGGAAVVRSVYLNGNQSRLTMSAGNEAVWIRPPSDTYLDQ